ncbi:cytochrome o ubiquinol oxidase subunit IV [Chelativorans sp. YIM 93263]|uniref:cytochrome o ubiquinol oxidase subunit IV n=1 Tax=Chelativorans sp. YIM 93263 TaxID=2906648 RepID=UPI002379E4C4|nr:cytochrome o ubiquinol oxidase subunit IV [Chelativorans sp. YIM 93263]
MANTSAQPSPKTYLVGLVLALMLTAFPFALVVWGSLPRMQILLVIAIAAVIQVLVHLRFFLHLDLTHTPRENLLAIAFAALLICIMMGGSFWIMFDLNHRMM